MSDIGDFIRRSRRSAKFAIAAPGHLAIFADRRDRRIKSPGVSPALDCEFGGNKKISDNLKSATGN